MRWRKLVSVWCWMMIAPLGFAAGVSIPGPLQPWQEWALRDHQQIDCPFMYTSFDKRQCQWPGILVIKADVNGLQFQQQWTLFQDGLVPLPGSDGYWPDSVFANSVAAPIVSNNTQPYAALSKGDYLISGTIPWQYLPDSLRIPFSTALISLTVNGAAIVNPNLDADGRLWFVSRTAPKVESTQATEDKLTVRVHRHLVDQIPFRIESLVDLEVSGKPREVVLGKLLFEHYKPLWFNSPLPARIDPDGRLRVQLRPGQWQLELHAHHNEPVDKIFFEHSEAGFWPEEEVWVFEGVPELRQVRIEGVDSIDSGQTTLPESWKQWPAYRMKQGQAMSLIELRRGDPQPSPNQLTLQRDLWLDFNGEGFTVRDQLSGVMYRGWRLGVDDTMQLGSLMLNQVPQVITEVNGARGVEVRSSQLQAVVLSRLALKPGTHKQKFSSIGWRHDVDRLNAVVHLPPGWRTMMATGMEHSSNTWLDSWSVWDIFVVLIAVAAIVQLRGLWAATVSGVALLLIYPEAGEFLYLLLNVIAVMALLFLLHEGRLRRLLRVYGTGSALVLILWLLGFMVDQARLGLYPQLQMPWNQMGQSHAAEVAPYSEFDRAGISASAENDVLQQRVTQVTTEKTVRMKSAPADSVANSEALEQSDPNLAAQTGPGLPSWQWQRTSLHWNGPVTENEQVTLWLLDPLENRILNWVRVLLSILLVFAVFGLSRREGKWDWSLWRNSAASGALLVVISLLPYSPSAMAQFPDADLLDALAQSQLKRQDCTPACLSIVNGRLDLQQSRMTLTLTVNARQPVYWPLPDSQQQWKLDSVVMDGNPHSAWKEPVALAPIHVYVAAGEHRLTLSGTLDPQQEFQLTFSALPHNLIVHSNKFTVRGMENGRLLSNTLHFYPLDQKLQEKKSEDNQLNPGPIAPFVQVERSLRLGRNWYMQTHVRRVAPRSGGISLDIPVFDGESVTSQDVVVENGLAKVVLKPGQNHVTWYSSLDKTSVLNLKAAQSAYWVEQWRVLISSLWNVRSEGIAPVKESGLVSQWQPRWHPYPGESLTLTISKPEAIEGATKTIDQVYQVWEPGMRESRGNLRLHILTSKGVEQRIELPKGAKVKNVSVDGEQRSVDELNPKLILPVNPGDHWIEIDWRQPGEPGFVSRSSVVNIDDPFVNHQLQVQVPRNRWVLFVGGPDMGPAILFWGVLLVMLLVALGLGQIKPLPLRAWHWILLIMGLSAGWIEVMIPVVLWFLLLLQRRSDWVQTLSRVQFNAMQVGIVLFSIITLGLLLAAIPNGLIGSPDMGIVGNGSSQYLLNWFVDKGQGSLPSAWFVSLPLWVYRGLMLVWSLWLVTYLLRWLKWGWDAFTDQGYWRSGVVLENSALKNTETK